MGEATAMKRVEEPTKPTKYNSLFDQIEDGSPDPERQCIAKELATIAFLGLRPLSRDTFILHKEEGWTSRELAGELGLTVETVKSRLFRARIHMRQQLNAVANNRSAA